MVRVKVHAKVNISLFITDKNEKYHALSSVVVSSSLYDEIVLRKSEKDSVEFSCPSLFDQQKVYSTILAMRNDFHFAPVFVHVERNIPLSCGLGGSSASVAGVIRAIDELFELKLTNEKMIEYANLTGSDNAFMLNGGAGLIVERSTPKSHFFMPSVEAVIVSKGKCETKDVFALFAKNPTYSDGKVNEEIISLLSRGEIKKAISKGENALTKSACLINKDIEFALKTLTNSFMTGSGSGVVAIDPNKSEIEKLQNVGFNVYHCSLGSFETESIKS